MHLLHMPYFSAHCCGLIEIIQSNSKHSSGQVGHISLAKTMGAWYSKIPGSNVGASLGTWIKEKVHTFMMKRWQRMNASKDVCEF